jgi:hypothetical protein
VTSTLQDQIDELRQIVLQQGREIASLLKMQNIDARQHDALTVGEYAKKHHISKEAVYKRIKRNRKKLPATNEPGMGWRITDE